jgi:hypothetical protein
MTTAELKRTGERIGATAGNLVRARVSKPHWKLQSARRALIAPLGTETAFLK